MDFNLRACLAFFKDLIKEAYMKNMIKFTIIILISSLVMITVNSCNSSSGSSDVQFTSIPVFELNPSGYVPLAGILSFSTGKEAWVRLDINDGTSSNVIEFYDLNTSHELTVLGLKPDRNHLINVTVIDEYGYETAAENAVEVTTDPLPEDFPSFEILTADTEQMEPGVTVVEAVSFSDTEESYMYAVNAQGEVVWFYTETGPRDFKKLDNGNVLFFMEFDDIIEMDMLGNVVNSWKTPFSDSEDPDRIELPGTKAFHHEVYPMPDGNYLVLDVEKREIENYPSSITSEPDDALLTETSDLIGDVIVEFSPDGTIVKQWKLLDILDTSRVSYNSDGGYWVSRYPDVDGDGTGDGDGTKDWSHGNAVVYDPSDDTIIVSARFQDAVIKIDRDDNVVWILGDSFGWGGEYEGALLDLVDGQDAEWPFHHHASKLTSNGTVILFDNGNYRTFPFDGQEPMDEEDSYSRVVEYRINTDTMQVEQVWQFGANRGEDTIFASFLGDVDQLTETGNILANFSGIQTEDALYATRIIEVTHDDAKDVLFELVMENAYSYRAERIATLY